MKVFLKKHRNNVYIIVGLLVISAGITAALIGFSAEPEKPENTEEGRLVETESLTYTPYTLNINGKGFIRSSRSLNIPSMVSAKVKTTSGDGLKSGRTVSKGEMLIELDDESARNSFSLARVELIQATASLLSTIKTETSDSVYLKWNSYLKELNHHNSTIPVLPDADSEREQLLTSTFGVLSAYYQAREKERFLSYYSVRAPFDGSIVGDGVEPENYVTPGATLLNLTDTVHLEVSVPLTREEIILLDKENKSVVIRPAGFSGGKSLTGVRTRQDAVMDKDSQTMDIHIRFDNPEAYPLLLPGNYAEISFSGHTLDKAYQIPRALINSDNTINVYKDGKLSFEPVEIEAVQDDSVILKPTIPEGTRIILTRIQKPFPGMVLKEAGTAP